MKLRVKLEIVDKAEYTQLRSLKEDFILSRVRRNFTLLKDGEGGFAYKGMQEGSYVWELVSAKHTEKKVGCLLSFLEEYIERKHKEGLNLRLSKEFF